MDTHKDYLETFCDHFYKSILRLVDDAVKKNDELMNDRIYADILQVAFSLFYQKLSQSLDSIELIYSSFIFIPLTIF